MKMEKYNKKNFGSIGKINFGEMDKLEKATEHKEIFNILQKASDRIIQEEIEEDSKPKIEVTTLHQQKYGYNGDGNTSEEYDKIVYDLDKTPKDIFKTLEDCDGDETGSYSTHVISISVLSGSQRYLLYSEASLQKEHIKVLLTGNKQEANDLVSRCRKKEREAIYRINQIIKENQKTYEGK